MVEGRDDKTTHYLNEPSFEDVLHAAQISGLLMEQDVAERLQSMDFGTETNFGYTDPEEGKSREIDVFAQNFFEANKQFDIEICLTLICECKYSRDYPFLFISRDKDNAVDNGVPDEYEFPIPHIQIKKPGMRDTFHVLGFDKYHYYYQQQTKAVQFGKLEYKKHEKMWRINNDGIFTDIVIPTVKAYKSIKSRFTDSRIINKDKTISLFFPIVVVDGDIYNINTSKKPLTVEKVKDICLVKDIQSSVIQGYYRVDFVTLDHLKEFIENKIYPFINAISEMALKHPDYII